MAKKIPPKPKQNPPKPDPNADPDGADDDDDDDDDDAGGGDDNARINRIVTARLNRFKKDLDRTLAPLTEAVTRLAAPKDDPDDVGDEDDADSDDDAGAAPKGKKRSNLDPRTSRMEREMRQLKLKLKEKEDQEKRAEEARRSEELETAAARALRESGITDELQVDAAATLLIKRGKIVRDDDGSIRFKGTDKYGVETLFDPKQGVGSWLKSDGKSFAPAVAVGGSGATGAARGTGKGAMSRADFDKLSPRERAEIEWQRMVNGEPPIDQAQ